MFITNGYLCDVVIVVAITNLQAKSPAHGISLFLVDGGTPGFTKGRKLEKMGLKVSRLLFWKSTLYAVRSVKVIILPVCSFVYARLDLFLNLCLLRKMG